MFALPAKQRFAGPHPKDGILLLDIMSAQDANTEDTKEAENRRSESELERGNEDKWLYGNLI